MKIIMIANSVFVNSSYFIHEDENIEHKIWTSDEADFYLSAYVSKQNFRYWNVIHLADSISINQPFIQSDNVLHDFFIKDHRLLFFFFFQSIHGGTVTIISERYSQMLEICLIPEFTQYGVNKQTFFQHDRAASHTAVIMNILMNFFKTV